MKPLSLFRIYWGLMMAQYFFNLCTEKGEFRYFSTAFHFRYPGLEFIPVVGSETLLLILGVGLVASIMFALGAYFKHASKLLFVVYLYVFLIDQSYYNNHYYMYNLVNMFFLVVRPPLHFSIDNRIRKQEVEMGQKWMLILFKAQVCIVYFYGGISKLMNADWVAGLATKGLYKNVFEGLGIEASDHLVNIVGDAMAFGGIGFDLLIPLALLSNHKVVKALAVIGVLIFNVMNAVAFNIGSFPYSMMAALVLFVWPSQQTNGEARAERPTTNTALAWGLTLFFVVQLVVPLRHLFIPGNVFWTSEGKMWSWHMMSGTTEVGTEFFLDEYDDDGIFVRSHEIDAKDYLNLSQIRNMGKYPHCVPQFARFLKKEAERSGMTNVKVYADVLVERNNKGGRFIISPKQELTALKPSLWLEHNDWILLYKAEGN